MEYNCLIQRDHTASRSIKAMLESYASIIEPTRIDAAMAYVTVAGLRDALGLLTSQVDDSRWVIGLDDAVTQPGAIDLCRSLAHADVRVAQLGDDGRRFHPKLLYLHRAGSSSAMMLLGSANLTRSALCGNAESVVVLQSETTGDKRELDCLWHDAWTLGHVPSDHELEAYRTRYSREHARRRRSRRSQAAAPAAPQRRMHVVLESDAAEVDPSNATTCWIECGNVTAMGRELEFKAEQGLFFGLNPHGGEPRLLTFRVSDGQSVQLRMKYQENHMWRLQMTRAVPEVHRGLRPVLDNGKLGRSSWVAVFGRTPGAGTFTLRFVRVDGREHLRLRAASFERGTCGSTTAREYGWY